MKPHPCLWLLVILILPIQLNACDVCGGGSGASGIGLFWAQPRSSIQLTSMLQRFQTDHGDHIYTRDQFLSFSLLFRHRLTGRWFGQVALPYQSNFRDGRSGVQSKSGLGDSRLSAHWIAWKKENSGGAGYVEIGGGIILPTGSYDANIHDHNLPENFNPGKGSWGWIIQPQANVTFGRISCIVQSEWKAYAPTPGGYRFGQEISAAGVVALNGLQWISIKWIPWIGNSFQWIETDHYGNGLHVFGTGGRAWMGSIGMQCIRSNLALGVNAQLPITQSFSSGEVNALTRASVNLGWFF